MKNSLRRAFCLAVLLLVVACSKELEPTYRANTPKP